MDWILPLVIVYILIAYFPVWIRIVRLIFLIALRIILLTPLVIIVWPMLLWERQIHQLMSEKERVEEKDVK